MTSDPDTIEIHDESTHDEQRFQLYIGGGPRALVTKRGGTTQFHWQVYGPQYWPQAQVLLQGLMELSMIADKLSGEK